MLKEMQTFDDCEKLFKNYMSSLGLESMNIASCFIYSINLRLSIDLGKLWIMNVF